MWSRPAHRDKTMETNNKRYLNTVIAQGKQERFQAKILS